MNQIISSSPTKLLTNGSKVHILNYLGFITDVKVVPETTCPTGYEYAVNFDWPGTGFGCYCQPNVNSSFVLEGYCTPLLIQS